MTFDTWFDKYYLADKLRRGIPGYAEIVRESHRKELDEIGYDVISLHDSVTGEAVWYPHNPYEFKRAKQVELPYQTNP